MLRYPSFYIPEIQKLYFHLPHVRIIGTHHCGNTRREAFKRHILFQYVLCNWYYYVRVVSIFAHQIKSKYYGGNIYVSIAGSELEHFSSTTQTEMELEP